MRREATFQTRLDAYEASAAPQTTAARKRRHRAWPVYAAAAASGLATATSADAAINYSGPQNLSATMGRYIPAVDNIPITMDGAVFNFKAFWNTYGGGVQMSAPGASILVSNGWAHGPGLPRLASGAKISNGAGNFGHFGSAATVSWCVDFGPWPAGQPGFAGVKFQQAGTHFGWIRLSWKSASGYPKQIEAVDWAYNSVAGDPILAGDEGSPGPSSAIPEPSSAVTWLGLLASGSVGVLALRLRKRQRAAATAAVCEGGSNCRAVEWAE